MAIATVDATTTVTATAIPLTFIRLPTKPTAELAYSFIPAKGASPAPLVVFLNGLGLPASAWHPVLARLAMRLAHPALLAYDRFGQGRSTDRDPDDAGTPDPAHGHDCAAAVRDLHQLLQLLAPPDSPLLLVGNSLGCALARLYAAAHPRHVAALLLLDSVIANSDMVAMYPDPDAADFARRWLPLPPGVTADGLRTARAQMRTLFGPVDGVMGRAEGLSRRNLAALLPRADGPVLAGMDGAGPWLSVVGHGFARFAADNLESLGIPAAITNNYMNPYWHEYNCGLAKITCPARSKGPLRAENCGHFIQRDDPGLVVREILELLEKAQE